MINLNRFSASHRKSTNDTILQNISISRVCVCVRACVRACVRVLGAILLLKRTSRDMPS